MDLIKLPGFVDVHVHLREPGNTQKENFTTGTMAAIAGGYTQILDMPNNEPPTTTPQAVAEKMRLTKGRIWCDVGFNFGATNNSTKYFSSIKNDVFGLKIYMNKTTGPLLIDKAQEREMIFKSWNSDLPIMVHATDETVETAIKFAKKYSKKIHICHVTTNQMPTIKRAKNDGVHISTEVCPHHLFLNDQDQKELGPLGLMQPPLMSKKNQEKMWDYINDIDMISTDHAPHTLKEKEDQSAPKFGVPGLETTLPLMLKAEKQKKISLDRIKDMLATNPRMIFKLPEQNNTFVLVDKSAKFKFSSKKLFTKCAWTPFKNFEGLGEIKIVVIRGIKVFENGKFLGKPTGQVIKPVL